MSTKQNSCIDCECNKKSIFADLDQPTFEVIDQYRLVNHYKKGQSLFLQGNPAFGVFCITSGKIKLVKSISSGNESIVRLVGHGEMLGFNSVLADQPNYATAVILEDCETCFFEKKDILKLISTSPSISLRVIKALSASLKLADLHTASKSQQNVREKLASTLLVLMKTNGFAVNKSCRLDIRLTRDEFASIIGSTLETVCRLFTELKNEGIIEETGKVLYVTNEAKLITFAGVKT